MDVRSCRESVPLLSAERLSLLKRILPTIATHLHSDTMHALSEVKFISSRAMAQIIRLQRLLAEVDTTVRALSGYIEDTVDDEIKDVAIVASQLTAEEVVKRINASSAKRGGPARRAQRSPDGSESLHSDEDVEWSDESTDESDLRSDDDDESSSEVELSRKR